MDASGALSVVARARTLADAQVLIDRGDAFAAVGIPSGTERDVVKGLTAHIPIYADATYLFLFRSLSSGITVAINALSSELAAGGARTEAASLRRRLPVQVRPTYSCNQSLIRSAATQAILCRQLSC